MSTYNDARDLVIDRLESIIAEANPASYEANPESYEANPESYEDGTEDAVRGLHVQSIVYRLMDQV